MLIGLVPLLLLISIAIQLYVEKTQKIDLLGSYISSIHQSNAITRLIDELQSERKYSYDYALRKDFKAEMMRQRPVTDSIIHFLETNHDDNLADFKKYTFLKDLNDVRSKTDSGKYPANQVMHFYSNSIFRLNTLNGNPPVGNIYLENIYRDLTSQKILSEMITYLGILCANVYNVLYTRQYMIETLVGSYGVYQVYKTYDEEFLLKADSAVLTQYRSIRDQTDLKPATEYLDTVFKKFSFDSTYDYTSWNRVSSNAIEQLRHFQQSILKTAEDKTNAVYTRERKAKQQTLIFLIVSIAVVIAIVVYTINVINQMLKELKTSALRIAEGANGHHIKSIPQDAIGSLAHSISKIDENQTMVAEAAAAIGKGNFDVQLQPRSKDDTLTNAILQMEANLKQLMKENLERKEEFMQLAEFMPQMIWTAGQDGQPIYYNTRWYEYTGLEKDSDRTQRLKVVHPDDIAVATNSWRSSVETGMPFHLKYRLLDRKANHFRWFLVRALPVKDKDGKILKWFGTITDIHETQVISDQLEELVRERTVELERSNDDLRQFAHIASHDLKEPLRKIQIFSNRVHREYNDVLPSAGKLYLEKVENSAGRMSKMIEGILNYSLLSEKVQTFEAVNLNEVMNGILNDLELSIQQKQAKITFDQLPTIPGIPILFHQLFYNLLNNALKFSKSDITPEITITSRFLMSGSGSSKLPLRPESDYVEIVVKDNGIGFEISDTERIFNIFTRLNSKDRYEGTGLGLALARKIVQRHNGFIFAEGRENEGASFFVVLPAE